MKPENVSSQGLEPWQQFLEEDKKRLKAEKRQEKELFSGLKEDNIKTVEASLLDENLKRAFVDLPKKLQDDIIIDLKKKRREGLELKDLMERSKVLVLKARELLNIPLEETDKHYKPKPTIEESRLKAELEKDQEKMTIDEYIEWLERLKDEGIRESEERQKGKQKEKWVM